MNPRPAVIAFTTLALLLTIGSVMAWPFVQDARVRDTALDQTLPTVYGSSLGFRQRHPPLADQCDAHAPERLRLYSAWCSAEHFVEIDLRSGHVLLDTGWDGEFRSADGKRVQAWRLTPAQTAKMREQVLARLPGMDRQSEEQIIPAEETAIEACIGGHPMGAVREAPSDDGFDELYGDLVRETGLEFSSSHPMVCI